MSVKRQPEHQTTSGAEYDGLYSLRSAGDPDQDIQAVVLPPVEPPHPGRGGPDL